MDVPGALVAVAAGFAGLTVGAELLVRGGARAARTLGLSTMVIGLTIVAYGTSAPELAASFIAALYDHPEVTLGNVLGSNIANIGLVLGSTALVVPFTVQLRAIRKELLFMLVATALFFALAARGTFGKVEGIAFLLALLAFNVISLKWARRESPQVVKEVAAFEWEVTARLPRSLLVDFMLVAGGLGLLAGGGHFLVLGAVALARKAGIGEAVIGITLVAVGTSLPELATSLVAAVRGEIAISVGNLVGSNLFNILGAIGISAVARPLHVPPAMLGFEFPALIVFTLVMWALLGRGAKVSRWQGGLLLAVYGLFIWAVLARSP